MLPRNHPDRIQIAFDDHRGGQCWAAAPGDPTQHLGLREVVSTWETRC